VPRSAFRSGMTGRGYRLIRPVSLRYRLRYRGIKRALPSSRKGGNCPREAEAQALAPDRRREPGTVRRPAAPGVVRPTAAPVHPVRASQVAVRV